jgi:hypothetical protein
MIHFNFACTPNNTGPSQIYEYERSRPIKENRLELVNTFDVRNGTKSLILRGHSKMPVDKNARKGDARSARAS